MTSHRTWSQKLEYFAEGVAKARKVEVDIPTPEQFAIFVNTPRLCPFRFRLESWIRLNHLLAFMGIVETPELSKEMLGYVGHDAVFEDIPCENFVEISRITKDGIVEGISDELNELSRLQFRVIDLEDARDKIPPEFRPQSFLVPLLQAWITEPGCRPMVPERRSSQILPEPVRHAVSTKSRLPVPTGTRLAGLERRPNNTGYLPGMEPPPGVVVPVLPLQVAEGSTAGAGAPITARLWFGCQMALPLDRRAGENEVLAFTMREVRDWL